MHPADEANEAARRVGVAVRFVEGEEDGGYESPESCRQREV